MRTKFNLMLALLAIPIWTFAQFDDVYYSSKNNKSSKTAVNQPATSSRDRSVDEYNRRYATEDTTAVDGAADMEDYEYSKRLAKYHNAKIHVKDAEMVVDSETGDVYIYGNEPSVYYTNSYDFWGYSPYYRPYYGWGLSWGWGSPYYYSSFSWGWGYPYYYSYPSYWYGSCYPSYYHNHYYGHYHGGYYNNHYYSNTRNVNSRASSPSRRSSPSSYGTTNSRNSNASSYSSTPSRSSS